MPSLKAEIESATEEPSTVEGSTVWPPTDAQVGTVDRSIDDYRWCEPVSASRGRVRTLATLNTFWGVRRVTAKALEQSNSIFVSSYKKKRSFNCSLQKVNITNVCVGIVKNVPVNITRIVEVPFMTNHIAVEAGEELLMEKPEDGVGAAPKAQAKKQKATTWKELEQKDQTDLAKASKGKKLRE